VFVLLFRGLTVAWSRRRDAGEPNAFARSIWPAAPMFVLAVGVVWLIQAQDLVVARMFDQDQGLLPNGQLLAARLILPGLLSPNAASWGYPLWLLVLFTLGALAFGLAYLDRISARVGRDG